ncbi:thiamine phosphate synthase [Elizabethkingia sp. JS20170427COW]|uniref:thiamine phosphate synthase n=1 Tax=Elizabethkingia sp. JS20170427COW TaxID=2583851 RepID=UPI00111028B2|nr:thiamine phosphate synthase [Elizabethkingia sp. JS20170427COW]QCX54021.1 thiamine phosphate synthase [Elizabethkingia sp. JS20170427COW]
MYSKLQYISQGSTWEEQEKNIRSALENGADWIQVRWKNASEEDRLELSKKAVALCKSYHAVCIINDSVEIAYRVNADGVHLGLEDESISIARSTLGTNKIIGGTANTTENIQQRIAEGCDYIGLGPFAFTSTKEKLSPILGVNGYREIIEKIKLKHSKIPPIYAIGGITLSDIENLKQTGIYGVALSGVITQQPQLISTFQKKLL